MKKTVSIFVSICMILSICLTNTTLTADAASPSPKIEEAGYVDILENEISSGQDGYTYNAPKPGAFVIENSSGILSITEGVLLLQFAGRAVALPSVDYYKIVDKNDNIRYYQADVLEIQPQISDFVYIGIYVENGTTYTLHVQYMSDGEEKMYNIVVPLSTEQFAFFDNMSTSLCIGSDDVSHRLKMSARIYTFGSFEQLSNTITTNSVSPMALNPIADNTFDSYTNNDGIIRQYVDDYFLQSHHEDDYITDDAIISIVPKSLFFIPGEHLYVGKEYGFFVRVVPDVLFINDYAADVMVFDITHTSPSFPSETTGSVKVEPLFQYKYRATSGNDMGFDPSLSQIVYPHTHYDYLEYLFSETGFKITLSNVDELNPGDTGYDPLNDNGAFIIATQLITNGVGAKAREGTWVRDTALFAFGFIPIVGTALSVAAYAHDLHDGFGNGSYLYTRDASFENYPYGEISSYETNHTDQISVRGNLIKAVSTRSVSDPNNPEFIHVGGSVETKYVVARKNGSTNNKIRITTSISVKIIEDNSRPSISGVLTTGDIVEYGRATGTYETGPYCRKDDMILRGFTNISFSAGTQRNIIKLTSRLNGSFKFKTISSSGDPHFYITNATKGTSTVVATDDIGSFDRNAELVIDLIANDIYYLEVFNYNQYHGFTLQIGYTPLSSDELETDIMYSSYLTLGTYVIGSFTPTTSGYYQIFTYRLSGDPVLYIMTSSGSLIDSDDDSGGDYNACIEIYLTAGVTFYVVMHEYNGYGLNAAMKIVLQE